MSDSFLHKPANDDYFCHQPFVHAAYTSQQHIALLCFAQPAKNQKWNTLQPATTNVHKKAKSKILKLKK